MAVMPPSLQTAKSVTRIFHDTEYTIRVHVDENGLNVEAETVGCYSQMWRSHFPHSFVEEISRRAGNVKSFPVFIKMLLSALDEESSSVHLDLLTARDLEMLRQRQDLRPPNATDSSNKRYLIMTYKAEFDKVHYPLGLQPVEMETVDSLRHVVQQLREQLERGTHTNERDRLRRENDQLRIDAELRVADAEQERVPDRRDNAELRHVKQSLSKYQNEVNTLRDAKQRLIIDHRKETEQLRKELSQSKSDVRRLEAQLKREMSRRGPSPTNRSVRSRPLSASSASSAGSNGSNRPSSSRYNRVNNRSAPRSSHQSFRTSPASSVNSFGRSLHSTELPPRRRASPSLDFISNMNARRPSPTRRSPDVARHGAIPGLSRPPSAGRHSNRSLSPARRPHSRSLSPSMRNYVSPYAQTSRPPRIPSPQLPGYAAPDGALSKPASSRHRSPARQPREDDNLRMRTGAVDVSDIDARLTALQNFLRNNQTMVES